mgnify:CR=1 FL=1
MTMPRNLEPEDDEPCYVISVAARMIGVHAQTLRYYERQGLLAPSRSQGKTRFYSPRDIERLRRIRTLTNDLGVNLAGVEVAMRLMERIVELEHQVQDMAVELARLRGPIPEGAVTDVEEETQ